ncbi:methyltransferase domain-containing protein [Candidatus Micrarchaeota archaeon]|nr:methyltransferase domain-containing protein [Candidatus Micrarchaeota archaeon]
MADIKKIILTKGIFSKEENERIYNQNFKDWYKLHLPIYKEFALKKEDRILDIGCSFGMNLIHFNKESIGLELTDVKCRFARSIGLNVIKTNVEESFKLDDSERFDVIWCTDFLIHLTSPYKFLLECRKYMDEDSSLILQIPQYTPLIPQSIKRTYETKVHYYAFNYPTLKYLVENSGYEVIKSLGHVRHFPYLVNKSFNFFLKRFGSNIWIKAKKDFGFYHAEKQPNFPDHMKDLYIKQTKSGRDETHD